MRRFFVPPEQIKQEAPLLGSDDARHARTVLRLKPGDKLIAFDGTGAEYEAQIASMTAEQVHIRLIQRLAKTSESPLRVTMAQGYLKDKKMDELVRRLTELGVHQWIPFMAHRSVPSPDEKRNRLRHQRWQKISQEAVKQCRRSRMMAVEMPVTFTEALSLSRAYDLKLLFWEGQGAATFDGLDGRPKPDSVFIMIGPEGGFENDEQRAAEAHGFCSMHLGPRILRAETAAMAACTLVQFIFGDMGSGESR